MRFVNLGIILGQPDVCNYLGAKDGESVLAYIVYRVIYDVDDAIAAVTVLNVGHRRNVYR